MSPNIRNLFACCAAVVTGAFVWGAWPVERDVRFKLLDFELAEQPNKDDKLCTTSFKVQAGDQVMRVGDNSCWVQALHEDLMTRDKAVKEGRRILGPYTGEFARPDDVLAEMGKGDAPLYIGHNYHMDVVSRWYGFQNTAASAPYLTEPVPE